MGTPFAPPHLGGGVLQNLSLELWGAMKLVTAKSWSLLVNPPYNDVLFEKWEKKKHFFVFNIL